MRNVVSAAVAVSVMVMSGCAKKSEEIAPQYISPLQYQSFSCRQIEEEARRVSAQASRVMGAQDKKASNDATATAVGLVLFWPALFFIKGNAETTAQVAQLKGEMDALEQASIRKRCGIKFETAAPAKKASQKAEAPKSE